MDKVKSNLGKPFGLRRSLGLGFAISVLGLSFLVACANKPSVPRVSKEPLASNEAPSSSAASASSDATISGLMVPLEFKEGVWGPNQADDIVLILEFDTEITLAEAEIEGCFAYIYQDADKNVCLGFEADGSYYKLKTLLQYPYNTSYESSLSLEAFDNVLGTSKGFKATAATGAASITTTYYEITDHRPILLTYSYNSREADLDGDGDKEVLCWSGLKSSYVIIKNFDGLILGSKELRDTFDYEDIVFDPTTVSFIASWHTEEQTKSFIYRDRTLAEADLNQDYLKNSTVAGFSYYCP